MAIQNEQLVRYFKFQLTIEGTTDPVLSKLTDEELETVLIQKCKTMKLDYPNVPDSEEDLLLCQARKEIYWKMATLSAPLYRLNLDGLSVAKEVRFDHYMKLISEVEKEYLTILNDPRRVLVQNGEVLVEKYYNKRKYYNNYVIPNIKLNIDKVNKSQSDFSINYNNLIHGHFGSTDIYVCDEPVLDKYNDDAINPKATLVKRTTDIHDIYFRVTKESTTNYYVLLETTLRNGLKAFSEVEVVIPVVS